MRFLAVMLFLGAPTLYGHGLTFDVDPARSSVTLSGTVAGSTIREQGPNSLTTTGTGTLEVELEGNTLRIVSGTVTAQNNGSWEPGVGGASGTAPANFGARATVQSFVTVNGAVRDVVLAIESPIITITDGGFPAEEITFAIAPDTAAHLDYSAGFFGSDRAELTGVSTNRTATTGTVVESAGLQTLTINVDTTFYLSLLSDNDSELRMVGQLVATERERPAQPVFRAVEIVDGEVRITVENGSGEPTLQSSRDLKVWVNRTPTIQSATETTTVYVLPLAGEGMEFYRLVE